MRNRYCLLLSAIASLSTSLNLSHSAQAQIAPDGSTATQVNGNAIAPTGSGTVNGGNLYHSFNEFNVPQSGVTFNTGNSSVKGAEVQNIINRVTGGNPSAVLGTIESRQAFPNANLYLINPNGIVFGQNARLDIGGSFHATTGTGLGFDNGQTFNVDKNSLSFPSGDPKNIRFAISQPAGIINQGNLSVDTGKSITFTGGSIINTGSLTAPSGNIALTSVAGNSQVELRSPDAVLGLQVTANAIPSNWNGQITELPKLAELLTGKVPEANQVVVKPDGSLALVANPAPTDLAVTNGMTIVSGQINVSTPPLAKGGLGGVVGIFGEKVGLVNAKIDASGVNGGGTVLIGGDFQGKGTVPNALRTFVDSNSRIDVSAILNGDGGKTIVWSDQSTRFLGSVAANGGMQSGNGGFVEVSGKQNLDYQGTVNTLALNGKIGTLLLDPTDINVVGGTGPFSFATLTDVDQFSDPDIGLNTLDVNLINFSFTNVTLQATNDINFNVGFNTAGSILTAQAGRDINFAAPVNTFGGLTAQAGRDINFTSNIATNGNSITFNAGRNITGAGNISPAALMNSAGDISLIAGGNITVNSIDTATTYISGTLNGGNVTVQAGGNILTTGTSSGTSSGITSGLYSIVANASFNTSGNAGNISLTSTNGSIDVSSGLVHAVGFQGSGGNITFQAAGNIKTGSGVAPTPAVSSGITSGGIGNAGNISMTSFNGAIDTSLGDLDAGNANIGNAGNIFLQAANNIITSNITASSGDGIPGNSGKITLISQAGSINTTAGQLIVQSVNGNAGTISLQASGDINIGEIFGTGSLSGGNINLTSINGAINTGASDIDVSSITGSGGSINFAASNDITIANLNTSSINANGGSITTKSSNGGVTTGNLNSSGQNGGNITVSARSQITTGAIDSSGTTGIGGSVSLDPIGNIIFTSANTSGAIQGGSFSAFSTGGNIRVLGFVTSPFSACAGASICTASGNGGSGGQIFLRFGGATPFTVGDPSINGTAGIVTTGSSTLALGRTFRFGTGIFVQGNILIAPSGDTVFTPPDPWIDVLVIGIDTLDLIEIREVMKQEVDRYFKEENLQKAFEAIEKAYVSELGIYLGEDLKPPTLNMNQAQDTISEVSKRSGSISVLIYPVILNDRIEILVVPPKELGKPFHRYTNYANEAEIITLLEEYRANLRDSSSQDYLVQAQKLYDWVIRPIDDRLQALKIETVVFVMDSGLRVIPPAAMHDGKQFLMERYASANIPSLRLTRFEERDRKNTNILAMGLTEAREGLSALPAVEVEVKTIGTQVLSGVAFLNQDFTVRNMQDQRSKSSYGILHLGTHGQFLADRAKDSYIQFWDSKLRSHQIPELRFDKPVIDMLTLSACETAVGNNLGISGLAIESGARSILASLWTVSDAGTAPLMINFYKVFPSALSKATALRQAQLDLLRGKVKIENNQIVGIEGLGAIALPKGVANVDLRHPYFWSSFILVGNWL
ncbi:CHAT domain-containing protein [Tumidithrix elongata RA019]|uniref:CHAT domain-containing protein n=1 Tax=Tumidithrix elongata BACA0141 TaxID=2716417 RepID=A0AAW9PYU2_9CYAN|nr:CHAT domain-containing protein [Tumidithrix elongata RA019]